MSEELPPEIRLKLLRMQKRIFKEATASKNVAKEEKKDPREIILSVLENDKAKEVLYEAEKQFPDIIKDVEKILAEQIVKHNIKSIDAYELYNVFLALGLNVKLPLRIKFVKRGKEVSIEEYVKDEGK